MAGEPVRQSLSAGGLRVRVAAGSEGAHEQLGSKGLLALGSVDRHRAPGVIDEELLPGKVPLAHRALQPSLPPPVVLAESTAPVSRISVALDVLFPQQLQRHMPMALQLGVDPGAVRWHELRRLARRRRTEHPLLQLALRKTLGLG